MSLFDHSEHVVIVNELNFEGEVLKSALPVLIDVTATWCAPCNVARPIIQEIARSYEGRLKVVGIDGGDAPALVASLGIRGFPTFISFANGLVIERVAGFAGKKALEAQAERLVAITRTAGSELPSVNRAASEFTAPHPGVPPRS